MAASHRAPRQWSLTKTENVNSFESWRQNLVYTLSLDQQFAPFLVEGVQWGKKTKDAPLRGFTDDAATVAEDARRTAQQKVTMLELMLGQIANYCPVISRNAIVRNSTSTSQIWQTIRLHYGFKSTGGHFVDFADIQLEPDERPEDLYQRLVAFIDDNLIKQGSGITHHDEEVNEDEELSPTLENMIVLTWLRLLHKDLPKLVKQRYGTELRSRTLASIKPEISQAIDTLLDEVRASEDARIMRAVTYNFPPHRDPSLHKKPQYVQHTTKHIPTQRPTKVCPLCQEGRRVDIHHYLSECPYLPEADRKFILRARRISKVLDQCEAEEPGDEQYVDEETLPRPTALRVQVRQSPYLDTCYGSRAIRITLDSGATCNMVRAATAYALGVPIHKSSQSAHQADGSSPLIVVGETQLTVTRDDREFLLDALVVENLDVEVLAGTPFMECNDVAIRPSKRQVILGDSTTYLYGSITKSEPGLEVRHATPTVADQPTTVFPRDYVETEVSRKYRNTPQVFGLKSVYQDTHMWSPPSIPISIAREVPISQLANNPELIKKKKRKTNHHHNAKMPVEDTPVMSGDLVYLYSAQTTRPPEIAALPALTTSRDELGKFSHTSSSQ